MSDCKKYKTLLIGLMDGELSPEEIHDVNKHLVKCELCRNEYDALSSAGMEIEKVTFAEPSEAELNRLWKAPYSRWTKNSGLLMILIGWLTLIVYAVVEALRDSQEPLFSRLAVAAVIIGFLVLLVNVLRERIITYKNDPYKEVER
ncbi:zf-HC2 domain-containing protein [bacterium]|nr:zf-HC2 domain-containing protein [bacterium]